MRKYLNTRMVVQKAQELQDGSVFFEGWANKAVVDRGNELIEKPHWKLENYHKNPIILFNHDVTKPIGKAIKVEARDEGLYVKARISNSADPEIARLRDLVKEGILNSLSVGISVGEAEHRNGVKKLKDVELNEISVVAVPMNQESQFSVTSKVLSLSMVKSIEAITRDAGHEDVARACLALGEKDLNSVTSVSEELARLTGVEKSVALDFLQCKLLQTPEAIKAWIVKKSEQAMEKICLSIKVSPDADAEACKAWMEEEGYTTENASKEGDSIVYTQNDPEAYDDIEEKDLGNGISLTLGSPKEKAEPVAEEPSEEDGIRQQFIAETEAAISGEEGNPPSWVTDEALWAKAKEVSQAALGELSYAFVTWYYMNHSGSTKQKGIMDNGNGMTQPLNGGRPEQEDVNPYLDQARQSNVLLANVVALLQQLLEKQQAVPQVTPTPTVQEQPPVVNEEPEVEEMQKRIMEQLQKTQERVKRVFGSDS